MILAGDIGGTNTRLGLSHRAELVVTETYPSGDFGTFDELLDTFLKKHNVRIDRACIGIAGPVQHNRCTATNLPWIVDGSALANKHGLLNFHVINDLEANAHGIAWLQPEDYITIHQGAEHASGNCAVISPGTGLGEAGMFWDGLRHHPFASEGGHSDFGPRNDLEIEMKGYLAERYGRVSYERVLSGPGLVNIYEFLRDNDYGDEPAWLTEAIHNSDAAATISKAAIDGRSEMCRQALSMFLEIFGAEAGNLALKMMATGGVWLGGGITARLANQIREHDDFMSGFTSKGKLSYVLEKIPVYAILNDQAAMLGAVRFALDQGG